MEINDLKNFSSSLSSLSSGLMAIVRSLNFEVILTLVTNNSYDNPALLEDGLSGSEPRYGAVLNNSQNKDGPPDYSPEKPSSNVEKGGTHTGTVQKPDKPPLDYDPHQDRTTKNPTTYLDTMLHLLKASLGTGILAMPNAFQNAGYLVGAIGTFVIGFLCTFNIHTLLSCEYELCRRRKIPHMTFSDTMQTAFEEGPSKTRWMAPWSRSITNAFLVMYQIGSSSIYVVFISSNIQDVYQTYYGEINIRIVMLYMLLPFILICWIRNLKLLVPFSTAGNAVTMLSFVIIFYYMLTDIPSISGRVPVGSMNGMPLFFGTVLFAMEAIGVIMPLKNEMKTPEKFSSMFGVLNASMLPISLLYTVIGFLGYLKYGSDIQPSVTLNLPNDQLLAQSVKILYSAAIYITYALSCYVAFDIIWNSGIKHKLNETRNKIFWEYVVRTVIVLITFIMAMAIPNLDLFIAFIGALCLSSMGVAFPAIIQVLVFWDYYQDKWQFSLFLMKNLIILLIAILAFVIGVSTSLIKIIGF